MKKLTYLGLILFCLIWQNIYAQDKIYKKGGEIVLAKVLEVGKNEIQYHLYEAKDGPIYILHKLDLTKIEYESGKKEIYEVESTESEEKTSAIKINLFSPVFGYVAFNYEKSIKSGRSVEFSLGLIGLGLKQMLSSGYTSQGNVYTDEKVYLEQTGVFFSGGYKFIKDLKRIKYGAKPNHILQGMYLKPQLVFGAFRANQEYKRSDNNNSITYFEKKTTVFGGLLINLGKQWVFHNFLLIDLYGGVGYDINNQIKVNGENSYNSTPGFHYGVYSTHYDGGSGIGLNGGLKIGMMIGR